MNIEITRSPGEDDLKTISRGLQAHNARSINDLAYEEELRFAVFARDPAGSVIGGIRAAASWGWMNIEVIWVDDGCRRAGIGRQLLGAAEAFAVENGVIRCFLETASFQAHEFYQKQGYEVFGVLDEYPKGHTMYYMRKEHLRGVT